jgi:predicted DNA-binding transcriptional regulator YafY
VDFRSFRLDRVEELQVLDEVFIDETGKTLQDFLRIDESEEYHPQRAHWRE